ncbi:winged helix-turn-helix transcriptional regulator [Domibacillus aminovorans]|nr:winged helix-turn-helix transcriptional regulator [Domibacillus aminovorans]
MPPKVEYSISSYGQSIVPVISALHEWGMSHVKHMDELYGEDTAKVT